MKLQALALTLSSAAASIAAVYELHGEARAAPAVPSAHNALLYLADKIGVGNFHSLGNGQQTLDFLEAMHRGPSDKPNLVVVLGGVNEPDTLFGSVAPSFQLHDTASAEYVAEALEQATQQLASVNGTDSWSALSREFSIAGERQAVHKHVQNFKQVDEELPEQWRTKVLAKYPQLKNRGLHLINDKLFMAELVQLVTVAAEGTSLLVAHLNSLTLLGRRFGSDSGSYKVAQAAVVKAIEDLQTSFDVTVVALDPAHSVKAELMNPRKRELDEAYAAFTKRGATAAKACFESKDACEAATNKCSGHGACGKVQAKCWTCACVATKNKNGRTTLWAGPDCSKTDISAQAHLLLWTAVALIVAMVGGVKLLYSIGNEPLPGVLQAATVDTTR